MAEINEILSKQAIDGILAGDKAISQFDDSLQKLFKDIGTLNTEFEKVQKSSADAATKTHEYNKMLNQAADQQNKFVATAKEHQKIQQQLTTTEAKITAARSDGNKKLIQQKMELQKTSKEIRQQITLQSAQKGSLKAIEIELAKNIEKYRGLSEAERTNKKVGGELLTTIKKQDAAVKKLNGELGRSQGHVGNYGRALAGVGKQLIGALGVTAGIAAFVGVLKNAVKTMVEFEKAQSEVAALSGKSKEELKGLTNQALQLGGTTEYTATQVSKLQSELVKLGFSVNEIQVSTSSILNFASATGAELPAAAKTAGVALRAFGLDASRMEEVTATLAVATTKSALSFADYETILSTLGPVAKAYGFSLADTVALTGKLKDSGFDASSAATATRNILLNLADSSGKLAKELGRPVNTLDDLVAGMQELDAKGVSVATTLELTDKRSVAAFNTFLSGGDSALKLRDSIVDVNGELQDMVDKRLDNLAGDVTKLSSAWEGFILKGRGGVNVFRELVQFATDLVVKLANIDLAFKRSSKLTEDEISRSYDVIMSLNDKTAKGFKKVTQQMDNEAFDSLANQEEAFKLSVKELGFSRIESEQMWGEYYKRRGEKDKLDKLAQSDRDKQQAEFERTQLIKKQEEETKANAESAKENEKLLKQKKEDDLKAHKDKLSEIQNQIKAESDLRKQMAAYDAQLQKEWTDFATADEADMFAEMQAEQEAYAMAYEKNRQRQYQREKMLIESTVKDKEDQTIALIALNQKYLQEDLNSLNYALKNSELSAAERIDLEQQVADIQLELDQAVIDADNAKTDAQLANLDKIKERNKEIAAASIAVTEEFFAFRGAKIAGDLERLEQANEAGLLSDKEYAKQKAELEIKAAKNERAQALFGIAVNTATGVARAISDFGPPPSPLGIIGIASALLIGGLQTAAVLSAPLPQVPAFAKGTDNAPSTGYIAGEAGRELQLLRAGEINLVDRATYFKGSKYGGAKIIPNNLTEFILSKTSHSGFSGSSFSDGRIVDKLDSIDRRLARAKTPIVNNGRVTGYEQSGNITNYLNRYR